jgi:hypothetical protein
LLSPHEKVEELYTLLSQQRQGGDSGGSQNMLQPQLMDEMAAKLRQAEDEREQLRGLAKSRDIEIERMLH